MIQQIVQIQEIDILHVDPLDIDHLRFHLVDVKILVLDIIIVIDKSILIDSLFFQAILNFTTNEQTPDVLISLFSEKITIVLFRDPTLEINIF